MVLTNWHQKVLTHTVSVVNHLFDVVISICHVRVFGTFSKLSIKICSRSFSENRIPLIPEHSTTECTVVSGGQSKNLSLNTVLTQCSSGMSSEFTCDGPGSDHVSYQSTRSCHIFDNAPFLLQVSFKILIN